MPLLFGEKRRFVILFVCIFEMVFMSGILYGWNGLVPLWTENGVFADFCPDANASYSASEPANGSSELLTTKVPAGGCKQQGDMLSNAFIVASSFQFIVAFPAGLFYDRFGLRVTKVTNSAVFCLACVLMALVSRTRSFLLFVGGCLLSVGASFMLLTNLQIGSLFPAWQYLIVSLYSGGFDSSSVVFTLMKLGGDAGLSLLAAFLALGLAGLVLMLFVAFFLFPRRSMLEEDPKPASEPEAESLKAQAPEESLEVKEAPEARTQPEAVSLAKCIWSPAFLFQVLWFSCILLRFQFFLAGFGQHLNLRFADSPKVMERLSTALGFFLFSGIFVAPLAGLITDFLKKQLARGNEVTRAIVLRALSLAQALCSLLALSLSAVMFEPSEAAFYVSYVLLVLTRAFLFSLNSGYFLAAFPPQLFGQLFGVCFFIGGVFCTLQYAMLKLGFIWSNSLLIVLTLVSFVHPLRLSGLLRCCRS